MTIKKGAIPQSTIQLERGIEKGDTLTCDHLVFFQENIAHSLFLTAFSVFMYFLLLRYDEVIIIASPLEHKPNR
jgi:hypothetical protein